MADRDLLFRVGLTNHPETGKRLSELSEAVKRTMLQIESSIQSVGRTAAETTTRIGESRLQPSAPLTATIERRTGPQPTATSSFGRSGPSINPSSPSLSGSGGGGSSDRLKALREDVRGLGDTGKQLNDSFDFQSLEESAHQFGESLSGIDRESAEVTKGLARIDKETASIAKSGGRNFRELTARTEGLGEGVSKLVSGLTLLGADSSNIERFVETLKQIQGGVSVVGGALKIVSNGLQTFSLLKERSEGAARSQELLADRTRLSSRQSELAALRTKQLDIAGTQLVATIRQEISAQEKSANSDQRKIRTARELAATLEQVIAKTRQLDSSEDALNRNATHRPAAAVGGAGAAVPRRGGRFGGLGAGIGSLLGFEAINAVTGGNSLAAGAGSIGLDALLSRGAGAAAGGAGAAAVAGAGGSVAGSGAATAGVGAAIGGLAVPIAAATAALGSLALVGVELKETFSGTATKAGSVTDSIAGAEVGIAAWVVGLTGTAGLFESLGNPIGGLVKSSEALERAEKRRKEFIEKDIQSELNSKINLINRGGDQSLFDRSLDFSVKSRARDVEGQSLKPTEAANANIVDLTKELSKELRIVDEYEKGILNDEKLYINALERSNVLAEKHTEFQQGLIAAIQQETQERKLLNDGSISAAEQRIGLLEREKGLFQTNQERIEAAAVKFARLGDKEKLETIQAQRTAQGGGQLTQSQRERLDALGLGAESNVVRNQDLNDARKSGFFEQFGSFEKSQLQGSQGRLGDIRSLQNDASLVSEGGTQLEREKRLRELNQRQERLGLDQQAAGERRAGGPRPGEGQFAQATKEVRIELTGMREFNIQLQTDEKAMIAAVQKVIGDSEKGQFERFKKAIELSQRDKKTEAVKAANVQNQQAKNSKPS